jgi:hypothetical protein
MYFQHEIWSELSNRVGGSFTEEGWFSSYPKDVDVLKFTRVGVMKDLGELEQLFSLFKCALGILASMDSEYQNNPEFRLTEGSN